MGKYYRNGRLWSGDAVSVSGTRTLAAATESTIWQGTAAARSVPSAAAAVKLVSTSEQDDAERQKRQTITITGTMDPALSKEVDVTVAGTMQPILTDTWEVTVGGAADAMDVARITINGVNFDYLVQIADTTALIAAGLADAVTLGSVESWQITPGGSIDVGDVFRITIDAVNYDYTVQGGDLLAQVCTGLAAAVNGGPDPHYGAAASATAVLLTALARGVKPDVSASVPTDPGLDSTCVATAIVGGVAADANYNPAVVGSVVTLTNAIAGVTADTVAASYPTDPGLDSTCVAVQTVTGADADIARFTVDGTAISRTIQGADTAATVATALAASLNGQTIGGKLFSSSAVGAVVTIVGPLATAYTVVDASVNNQGGGVALSCTPVTTQTQESADVVSVNDGTNSFAHTVTVGQTTTNVATALAALLDADALYIATSNTNVVTVRAATDGVDFTLTDNSTDNQTGDLSVVIATTLANGPGTGIRTVRLDYLDTNGVRQSESVDLNGTTAVQSAASDVLAVVGVTATDIGSGGGAAGIISVKDTTLAIEYEAVAAGAQESSSAMLRVPDAQRGYVAALQLSAGATATTVKLKSDTNPATGAVVSGGAYVWHTTIVGTDPVTVTPAGPIGPFPEAAKIWLTGTHAGGTAVAATIDAYYEPAA